MFRAEIDEGPPPGIIAYVDGEAAGWIRIGATHPPGAHPAHSHHRRGDTEPFDDESVWAGHVLRSCAASTAAPG